MSPKKRTLSIIITVLLFLLISAVLIFLDTKKMNEYYDAETKRVNSSFTNQADKDRELKKLEVQKEAQQKRIDRDRITADRKRAQQQKAYDIAKSINTAPTVDQNAKSILFGQDAKTVT